jgi:hypothetical protein
MLRSMAMFTRRITSALFAIAIASSLILVSGGLVGSAFAAKKERDGQTNTITDPNGIDISSTPKSHSENTGDSNGITGDSNGFSSKELKKLSKCQSDAAADGDLTLADVKDCYRQMRDQGQGQEQEQGKEDQSSSAQGQLALGQA